MIKKASCPTCEKEVELSSSNSYRPFCSKRCRLIDFGQWIEGSYTISDSIEYEFPADKKPTRNH